MAATSFDTMEFDPITGQTKQKKDPALPYLNPNEASQGYLPYVGNQQQGYTQDQLQQQNANVMGTAQQTALNQANPQANALQQQTTAMTQKLMTDPSMGMDWQKYNTGQLSQYDASQAGQMQKAKANMAGMGGSGKVQDNLIKLVMQQNTDRSALDNELQVQAYEKGLQDYVNALGQGRTQAGMLEDSQSKAIDNLLKVRQGFEGERSQTSANDQQIAMLEKTFGFDMAKLVASQDWQGVQNQLDRDAAVAKQNNDINAQKAVQERQIAADMERLKVSNDFQGVQAEIERKWKSAESSQDRDLQNSIVERQLALDKWKQENGQEFTKEQNALNRALELTLKDKDAETQSNLLRLKGEIDKGNLLTQQDFQATQNDLDRKLQDAKMKGDWASAVEITKLKGEIDAAAQTAQNNFVKAEREATQSWSTSERVDQNKLEEAAKILDRKHELAMQSNDIQATKDIEEQRMQLQLKLQTNDMAHDEKMAYLNNELAEAKANNDVKRQKEIMAFQTQQDFDIMERQYGYDAAMEKLKTDNENALRANDYVRSEMLQRKQLEAQAAENEKDRVLEQARVDLEKAGVDMQKAEQTYNYLAGEVEAGRADPSVLTAFVQGVTKQAGVTITPPDPNAVKKAAQERYASLMDQFTLSHPEYIGTERVVTEVSTGREFTIDDEDLGRYANNAGYKVENRTGMTMAGKKAFNEFYNSSVYGEMSAEQKAEKANAGYLGKDELDYAAEGDQFSFESPVSYNGQSIPAGKYNTVQKTVTTGNKFWGMEQTNYKTYLKDQKTGQEYLIEEHKGSRQGNIVSNLWT